MADDGFNWLLNLRKFGSAGLEDTQLKTSIKANIANTQLAEETLKHFKDIRKSSNISLIVSGILSLVTIIILIVQTVNTQTIEISQPITLQERQMELLTKSATKDNLLLVQQVDSLKVELRKLNMIMDSAYNKTLD